MNQLSLDLHQHFILNLLRQLDNSPPKFHHLISSYNQRPDHNWDQLWHLIRQNKLELLLQPVFSLSAASPHIPPNFRRRVSLSATYSKLRMKDYHHYLKLIVSLFKQHHLNFLVFKTLPYQSLIYTHSPHKIIEDIDLLIPPSGFKTAAHLLSQIGFTHQPHPQHPNSLPILNDFYSPHTQETFRKAKLCVELHTSIIDTFDQFTLPLITHAQAIHITQNFFQRQITRHYHRLALPTLTLEDLLLSQILHSIIHHNFQPFISYFETHRLLTHQNSSINWSCISQFTSRYLLQSHFSWYFSILESYFPHTLPSPIRNSTNKEIGRLNPLQKSIYAWLTRQTFTPQQFHIHPKLERQKEWTWAIIAGQPLQVVLRRIRQYSLWFFGTLTLFLKKILGST